MRHSKIDAMYRIIIDWRDSLIGHGTYRIDDCVAITLGGPAPRLFCAMDVHHDVKIESFPSLTNRKRPSVGAIHRKTVAIQQANRSPHPTQGQKVAPTLKRTVDAMKLTSEGQTSLSLNSS